MPTVFTHALAGAAIAGSLAPSPRVRTLALIGAAVAVLPDADVTGWYLGYHYHSSLLGHRGLTHSLLFAAVVATVAAFWLRRKAPPSSSLLRVGLCLFLAMASHGLLDALTDGGSGVAFFAPFDTERYFFPATPILVAPLRAAALFTARGAAVMASEIVWVWIPAALFVAIATLVRRRVRPRNPAM